MTLEMRYRRLLAVYPAEHRRAYAEEMLGVLMAGARPGQRRPSPREAADLLWCGLAARTGGAGRAFRGAGWRDAAAVAGLIGAIVLAAVAVRRLVLSALVIQEYGAGMYRAFGVDGGQLLDVGVRALVWLAVVAAAVAGLRRTAGGLAIAGLAVEIGAVLVWVPEEAFRPIRMSWAVALAVLVALLVAAARHARPPAAVLGRAGAALLFAPLGAALVAAALGPSWLTQTQLGGVSLRDALVVAGAALLVPALRRAPGELRGRIAVLLAPLAAVPVAQAVLERVIGIQFAPAVTPGIVVAAVVIMTVLPALALAAAVAVRHAMVNPRIKPAGEAWDEITPGNGTA